jgi:hypothetical protein
VQVRDVAFGECDDVDAGEGETLEETGGVFLVATEAVQRFGEDDVEAAMQSVAPEIAWSVNSSTTAQPWRAANSRQMRSWSAIDASR